MDRATVVNLFFTVRVLLVGGLLLVLPRVTRQGLLFGVYVGEDPATDAERRRVLRRWNRGCLVVMAVSYALGMAISAAGRPVAGNLTGTAVLLLLALGLYLRTHANARALAPPPSARQVRTATAALLGGEPKGELLAKVALIVCLIVSLVTVAWAVVRYEEMPADVSAITIMLYPSLNLLLTPFLALIGLLTSRAKRSVRQGPNGRSAEAQDAFRGTLARTIGGMALLVCSFFALLSVQLVRLRLGEIDSLGIVFWCLAALTLLFMFVNVLRILLKYGQGGALMEGGSAGSPLAGGLADNARWVWGMFYVDRSDPAIMVEKRFGFGYTFNYGNRNAVLIAVAFLVLLISLITLVVAMSLS